MPTYTYRCSHCKYQFDKLQKFSDPPIERCPNCRRKSVHKVLHPAPIQFKGAGWYVTDSKGSSSSTTAGKPSKKKEPSPPAKTESSAPSSPPASGGDGE